MAQLCDSVIPFFPETIKQLVNDKFTFYVHYNNNNSFTKTRSEGEITSRIVE